MRQRQGLRMSRYDGRFDVLVALRDKIAASAQPWFVLIDPMSRTDLSCIDQLNRQKHLVDLTSYGLDRALCPYVVRILGSRDELLEETVSLAWERRQDWQEPQPVCGWLCSNLSPGSIALSIKQVAVTRTKDGNRNLRRFYDPRVVRHASFSDFPVYAPDGWEQWLQLGFDGNARLVPHRMPDADRIGIIPSDSIHEGWVVPTVAAIAQLQRFGESPSAHEQRLQLAVRCGIELGLSPESAADAVSFLLHKVLVHPEIEQHPTVRTWLKQAVSGEASYADQSAEASSSWWHDVESGQWQKNIKDETRETRHG